MSDPDDDLAALTRRLDGWLCGHALPLWWDRGADHVHGGFFDGLDEDGHPTDALRRARVQARQSWVYGIAGEMGWNGPWQKAAEHGLAFLTTHCRRPDGQFSTLAASGGAVLDRTAFLYDQTFILLALAQLHKVLTQRTDAAPAALALLNVEIAVRRHAPGGYAESGEYLFQSNPLMHLFEAALAWCETGHDQIWDALADELAGLCLSRLIDPASGAIPEYFGAEWNPLPPGGVQHLEPGHQFEWAWLLGRWSALRRHAGALQAARRLFAAGLRGVDPARDVAIDEMSLDFVLMRPTARLWPQAERIKAALLLSETASGTERLRYRRQASGATRTLLRYLETPVPGLWRDRMTTDGKFIEEPAPASSFYHIICCISVLKAGMGQ